MKRRSWYFAGTVISLLLAGYFFTWTIQTAWLGSFPGRDVELYGRWSLMQFIASVLFLILAIVAFVLGWRRRE
jgi:hypothetical protein